MRFLSLIVVFCYLLSFKVIGQEVDSLKSNKIHWQNAVQLGVLLDGNVGLTGRLSTSFITGLNYDKWTIGLGIGIDDYEKFFIFPVLVELKYNLLSSNNSPFVYSFGAYNYLLQKSNDGNNDYKGGLGVGAGVGYEWDLGIMSLFIKSGFQHTKAKSEQRQFYYDIWDSNQFYPQPSQEITRSMGRVTFMMGINF